VIKELRALLHPPPLSNRAGIARSNQTAMEVSLLFDPACASSSTTRAPKARPRQGVMLIPVGDEAGVANLVILPSLYEHKRRIILTAGMLAVRSRIHRENDVVHLVVRTLLSANRSRSTSRTTA
jgi:DNA polymerase III alpha subunit